MLNSLLTPKLINLREQFVKRGFDLRLVGGCVRDLMANIEPKDVDLCTDANPSEQLEIYNAAGVRFIETGLQHGTITVVLDDITYEITSLRTDVETDGRHAIVEYTTDWILDLERRDFTINAMSMTFDGTLIDPFNGLADLRAGLVKFVGNAQTRIEEDYLRILRWFRFRGRVGMDMSYDAQRTIAKSSIGLEDISRERVWSEVRKIIAGQYGSLLMSEMHQMGVARHIDLPVEVCHFTDANEVQEFTSNPVTLLVAMYGEIAVDILTTWKASRHEIDLASHLYWAYNGNISPFMAMALLKWPREHALELAALLKLDAFERSVLTEIQIPVFPVGGADLIKLGLQPGPNFSLIITQLKSVWADNNYTPTKEELLGKICNGRVVL